MTKNEFMRQLRTYLIYEQASVRNEILEDYEEYFAMAKAAGRSEEETAASLGRPSEIAALIYGVDEKKLKRESYAHDLAGSAGNALISMKESARKHLPSFLSKGARVLSLLFTGAGTLAAALTVIALAIALYLSSGGLVILPTVPALPAMSPLSLTALAVSGLSFSAFFYYAGRELSLATAEVSHTLKEE